LRAQARLVGMRVSVRAVGAETVTGALVALANKTG
jgi:hypothetical protein